MTLQIPVLRPFQLQLEADVHAAWNQGAQNVLMRLDTGGGKCLGRGTPVMMADGSIKPVEKVMPGEQLMGPDSRPRNVLSVCRGREMLYRVTPKKGDPYVVNESHILSLKRTPTVKNGRYPSQRRGGEIVNIPVLEYLAKSSQWRHIHKGWRVAVEFPKRPLPATLPPYLLGLWLGDGSSKGPAITTMDPEIAAYLSGYAQIHNLYLREEPAGGRSKTIHLSGRDRRHGKNALRQALKDLGLVCNKHVPEQYRTAHRSDRLELLAGLLDTDGGYTGKGYDFISVNEQLAKDVAFVARTLGFFALARPVLKSCNGGPKAQYWRVHISGDIDAIPCRVPRKIAAPRRQKKSVLMTGLRVEAIGDGEYFGFEIDGDRLFVLGDCTVTHNTVTLSSIVRQHGGASCVIAHRQELVGQLSLTLARNGIRHNIIAAEKTRRAIAKSHVEELGQCFYDPGALCCVASVDTLVRAEVSKQWLAIVTLWIVDEGHHLVLDNKWHTAISMFTNPACRGLLPTATPRRADRKGLGRRQGGVADVMVEGPPMRWLIDNGYLSRYRIICPTSDLQVLAEVSASGDWSTKALREAAERSHIVGDVVAKYLEYARGTLGVTFAGDVKTAGEMAAAYRLAGVRAELLTGKTDDHIRRQIIRRFAARELDQIVAVDIISEGFDLPAIETLSMARPTQSLALYMQQFGRALRVMEGKGRATILDHVGNVVRHQGPPDTPRVWSLLRGQSRASSSDGAIPITVCVACFEPYPSTKRVCPHCGHYSPPTERSRPEVVAGDMGELDPAVLAQLVRRVDDVDKSIEQRRSEMSLQGWSNLVGVTQLRNHEARQQAQTVLRSAMGWFGGLLHERGADDSEIQRTFFFRFGVDVVTAQTLGAKDALALAEKIKSSPPAFFN